MVAEISTNQVPRKNNPYRFPQSLGLILKWQNCYNNYLHESPANDLLIEARGAEARGARAASGEAHPSLERGERVALQLDRAVVPPFPSDGAHVPLQHQHLEPLPPGGKREGQAADAAAGHQDARLGLH